MRRSEPVLLPPLERAEHGVRHQILGVVTGLGELQRKAVQRFELGECFLVKPGALRIARLIRRLITGD